MITHAERLSEATASGRIAGMHAVQLKDNRGTATLRSGSAVVQRKLHYTQKNLPKPLQKNLLQEILAYNNYSLAKSNTKIALHKQFELLDAVDTTINTYLRNNTATISDSERLELFRILRSSENDHIRLTGRLAQHNHDIWLGNTNQTNEQQEKTQKLWHSLRQGTGNVKIDSKNKDFKNQALSGFAQMLRGDHGRGILKDLNKFRTKGQGNKIDKDKHIFISDNFLERFKQVAKNKQGDHSTGSWALSVSQIHKGENDHRDPLKGSGSYVQIENATPGSTKEYSTDTSGKPLHEPKYITLAHELGHAKHSLAGTAKSNDSWPDNLNGHPLKGKRNALERKQWTSLEEHTNITTEENPVRSEHGLPVRKYHASKQAQIAHANRFSIDTLFESQAARVPAGPQYQPVRNQLGAFSQRIQTRTDMSDKAQVKQLRKDLETFRQNLPHLIQTAQQQYQAQQRTLARQQRINRIKSYIPSKNTLIKTGIGLGVLGTGIYGYTQGWFG